MPNKAFLPCFFKKIDCGALHLEMGALYSDLRAHKIYFVNLKKFVKMFNFFKYPHHLPPPRNNPKSAPAANSCITLNKNLKPRKKISGVFGVISRKLIKKFSNWKVWNSTLH